MSAHGGVGHWLWQRLSSVILVPLTAWLLWAITRVSGASFAEASLFIGNGFNAAMAILTTAVVAYHAQSGIQVICEDYIPPPWQSVLIWLTRIACLAGLLALAWAVLGIAGRAGT